jgi:hypothetical protein
MRISTGIVVGMLLVLPRLVWAQAAPPPGNFDQAQMQAASQLQQATINYQAVMLQKANAELLAWRKSFDGWCGKRPACGLEPKTVAIPTPAPPPRGPMSIPQHRPEMSLKR